MKKRFLRKLKTISTPIWTSTLAFQPTTPPQMPNTRESPMDPKQDHPSSNANAEQKVHSKSEEKSSISLHDQLQPQKPGFEDMRCPPGGQDAVVLYTTSLRGIRKTFEDCNTIRFLLESFKVVYSERDVSMHLEYREELWKVLEGRAVPPKVFIRGRYIGGADEVVGLHEKGRLESLLRGIPLSPSRKPCGGCGGVRFVLCAACSGSRKVVPEDGTAAVRCPECNENGLVKCCICSVF